MNAWLVDECVVWAKAHAHPEQSGRTIWEVFEEERPRLIRYRGRFDGFHARPASVSKTCLVRFDNNRYSVSASAVGRPVDIHAYADRIVIRRDGRIVAEHPRVRPWAHRLRPLALRAGPGAQARRPSTSLNSRQSFRRAASAEIDLRNVRSPHAHSSRATKGDCLDADRGSRLRAD